MKIVCDNCATKYSISDDKVRGKMFKIRCKKCSHVIVVRGTEADASGDAGAAGGDADGAAAGFEAKDTRVFNQSEASGTPMPGMDAPTWHLVIDREQVGPMTTAEVHARAGRGEVTGDTYVWRDGMTDWVQLQTVAELASALKGRSEGYGSDAPTERADSAALLAHSPPAAEDDGLFAAAPKSGPHRASYGGGGNDIFASTNGASGDLFASPSGNASSDAYGGATMADPRVSEPAMTGQRHENSVLFSLTNLQALATTASKSESGGSPAAKPGYATAQNEGSGLIDIRAMAASVIGSVPSTSAAPETPSLGGDDLPSFGMSFSPVSAPVLMPTASSEMPSWMKGVLIAGGVFVLMLTAGFVYLLTPDKPAPVVVAPPAPVAPTSATPPTGKEPGSKRLAVAPSGVEKGTTPTGEATGKAEGESGEDKPKEEEKSKSTKVASGKRSRSDRSDSPSDGPPPPRSDQPVAPRPSKPKAGGDELDALLNNAIGGGSAPRPQPRQTASSSSSGGGDDGARAGAADESLPSTLSPRDIQGNMAKVRPRVMACYQQYNVPGTVFLDLTISPAGRVQNAVATGKFSGTPTGDCVARAAKGASFPRFKGSAISIQYPFMLSK